MIIQATPYGTKTEEPFAFTYSGDFTDSRVDGIGDVTLNTSGTLVTTGKTVRVTVYILAGGGGARTHARNQTSYIAYTKRSGGGGGNQTVEVELAPGVYEITIGLGGEKAVGNSTNGGPAAANGGNTIAFGYTSTGGDGASGTVSQAAGGSPNGGKGDHYSHTSSTSGSNVNISGGSPNGGAIVKGVAYNGGNGLVRITFS